MNPSQSLATHTLNPDEARLLELWQARVASGDFSEGVSGTRQIRVMGRSGDTPVALPRLAPHALLDNLSPEERFAIEYGDRLVRNFRSRSRSVFSNGMLIEVFDPTDQHDLIVLSPIAGG